MGAVAKAEVSARPRAKALKAKPGWGANSPTELYELFTACLRKKALDESHQEDINIQLWAHFTANTTMSALVLGCKEEVLRDFISTANPATARDAIEKALARAPNLKEAERLQRAATLGKRLIIGTLDGEALLRRDVLEELLKLSGRAEYIGLHWPGDNDPTYYEAAKIKKTLQLLEELNRPNPSVVVTLHNRGSAMTFSREPRRWTMTFSWTNACGRRSFIRWFGYNFARPPENVAIVVKVEAP